MKKYYLFIFCFFIVNYCNAQEILFKVIKDTPVWNNVRTRIDSNSARIINKNMIISNISPPVLMEINGVITYGHTDILFEKIKYSIQSNTFSFANNVLLFNDNKNVIIQINTGKNSLPLPLLLAIVGGAAVAVGVVAVVVLKKKK